MIKFNYKPAIIVRKNLKGEIKMKPFENLKVLDLTRVLSGPYASMLLADFGADVIKIEAPGTGDDSRSYGPFIGDKSMYFMNLNRGKRSITLNLKTQDAKNIFKKMVKQADIVIENYRPGTMDKFGLGYEVLKDINPKIIYATCSGFGDSGPYRERAAYDVIVQAMGGIMSITGQEGGELTRVGASIGDITAGLFTAIGILTALYSRVITGKGQKVDVAMLDCQVAILENAISRYFSSGVIPVPIGNRHPSVTPFEGLTAKDGQIIIAVGNDNLWAKFARLINKENLIDDARFRNNLERTKNQKILKNILESVFAEKTVFEWRKILDDAGIPCAPINTIDKVVTDPQIIERKMIVEINDPSVGQLKFAGVPIKLSDTPGDNKSLAPMLGQDTEDILKEMIGVNASDIATLYSKKVI